MILLFAACICDDRYRDAITSRLLCGKKKEEKKREKIQKNGTGKRNEYTVYVCILTSQNSAMDFLRLIPGVHDARQAWITERADEISSERRDRTRTRGYSGLRDFQSGVLKLTLLIPRPPRTVHRGVVTPYDIHYQIFEFKMEDVHILLSYNVPIS